MKSDFWLLEKLGRERLSKHFYMRQFLYSEIGAAYGMPNVPDDPDRALRNGSQLCELILEPLWDTFGPIQIRSAFRSAKLNAFGAKNRLKCAPNERNYAYHIWDHVDALGFNGAAACVVIPSFVERSTSHDDWKRLADHIHETLPYHRLTFFQRDFAFNIGWHENPRREIYSRVQTPHWFVR